MRTNWRDILVGIVVYALLVTACVVGHAAVSAKVAHGEDMPILYTDTYLPAVGK